MKTITRILTITLISLLLPAAAWAQNVDAAYKAFTSLRNNKEVKPSQAHFQKMSAAGIDFLVRHANDTWKSNRVINDMLSYGTSVLAKDPAQRAAWFAQVQFGIIEKQANLNDKAKGAFAALGAAIAEGEIADNFSQQAFTEWRAKIDQLNNVPNGTPFLLDREKGYYKFVTTKLRTGQRFADAQIAALVNSKDRNTANWAKREARIMELRKTPYALSFTALDGKQFDSKALKGKPALYVYFWSTGMRNATREIDSLMDAYFDMSRRKIEFVAVCVDPEDKRADVTAFVKKLKVKCPVYFDGKGTKGGLYVDLAASAQANGHLFNANGILIGTEIRPADLKKHIR